MINVCLTCKHSGSLDKPISYTTGNHIHTGFSCDDPPSEFRGAYGEPLSIPCTSMIVDLVTMTSWIDGSSSIPKEGCSNYERSEVVNKEVEI